MSDAIAADAQGFLARLIFAMLRAGGAFLVAPIFSALAVPLQLRILIAAAIAVAVVATHPIAPPPLLSAAGLLAAIAEIAVGAAMGFVLQLAFAAPMLAGEQIAAGAGLSFAAISDPQSGASSPAIGNFLAITMTLLFLALDGHLVLIEVIVGSYVAFPVGAAWLDARRLFDIAEFGGFVFSAGLLIALPVAMTLFAINLALGVLTRAAPQMNIFSVGLPLTVLAATIMLAIAFPALVELLQSVAEVAVDRLRALAGTR